MARVIEEELIGYGFGVRQVEVQATDENGQPVFNGGAGGPKMEDRWILDFVSQTPFERHIVHLSLTKDAKDELVRQLTGGIVIAGAAPKI